MDSVDSVPNTDRPEMSISRPQVRSGENTRAPTGLVWRVIGAIISVKALMVTFAALVWPASINWRLEMLDAALLTLGSAPLCYLCLRPFTLRLRTCLEQLDAARTRTERVLRLDALTGLFNRNSFFPRFEREWDRSSRYGTPMACVMLDLDHFKQLNATHGHAAGDEVLRVVGRLLRKVCGPNDIICRYSGEEFCIILPGCGESAALQVAQRMIDAVARRPVSVSGGSVKVTASCGVAERGNRMSFPENLLELADWALWDAKQTGRNRVSMYGAVDASGLPTPQERELPKPLSATSWKG